MKDEDERISMTPQQWLEVEDNPRQRDTFRHAQKAVNNHLKAPSRTQNKVAAARLPSGELVKLDGHTRALLWSDGRLPAPARVKVDVYDVVSMEEVKALYGEFDSNGAVEGAVDKLFGAYKEHDFQPQSDLLLNGAISSSLSRLSPKGATVYAAVKNWRHELTMLDSLNLTKNRYQQGLVIGALALLRVRKSKAMEFLQLVGQDAGVRTEKGSDGVDAFCRFYNSEAFGKDDVFTRAGKFISAGEGYITEALYVGGIKSTNLVNYLSRAGTSIGVARLKVAA